MNKEFWKKLLDRKFAPFILVLSLAAGIVLTLQIRGTNEYAQGFPSSSGGVLSRQYVELQERNNLLSEQVEEYKKQLDIIRSTSEEHAEETTLEELRYFRLAGGFTDVRGEGVLIYVTVDDPAQTINMADLQEKLSLLVNELNAAGAEAISINEERIISKTEIRLAGVKISINGHQLTTPFTVKAIGNKDTMEAALLARYGFVERLRAGGYFVEVKKSLDIDIPGYNGRPRYEYAVPMKDE